MALRGGAMTLAVVGASTAGLVVASPAGASVRGTYTLTYDWGFGPATAHFTLAKHHQFTTDDGNSGTYAYSHHALTLTYATGCLPVYTGTGSPRTGFSGTMACTDGSGGSGTWSTGPVGTATVSPATASSGSTSSGG
ncbi:MAG TPA: hypothetical protein VKG43_12225 [Acidimicrobiales bacterium]|nr:hypothetical protein [Acidimicrobiales bacterium]